MPPSQQTSHTLATLKSTLLPTTKLTPPPTHPTYPSLTPCISALLLHPTIEATLHILNADLPSAHFLVRHMQAPPAVEGMLLHSILHRCEGDFENARAWAGDVGDVCSGWVAKRRGEEKLRRGVWEKVRGGKGCLLDFVYGRGAGENEMGGLIDDVERFRVRKQGVVGTKGGGKGGDGDGNVHALENGQSKVLEKRARLELERVLEWCVDKFGDGVWMDASEAWVNNSAEVQKISNEMVSGGDGWRKFRH